MREIKKEEFNEEIKDGHECNIEIIEDGLYCIEIIASAKSWWQNAKEFESFFGDDDLAMEIDGMEFSKLNAKKGLFDGTASWNGNNLKGLLKTNLIYINLSKGSHLLKFFTEQKPFLKSILVNKIENNDSYILNENNPAQDGNRRQWLTIIAVNLPIEKVAISAVTKSYPQNTDDDDIKLIIDGEIQKNVTPKSHSNWFWCGRVSNGQKIEFKKDLNWKTGLHYIDLWADKMPLLNEIKLAVGEEEKADDNTKRIPTVDDPMWTENFHDDTEQMILARLIFGEARGLSEKGKITVGWCVKNRVLDVRWGDNYHDVILEPKQYSAFNEGEKNLPYVKNPLAKDGQLQSWRQCYEIAGKILNNEVGDPTNGANHYFSDFIDPPYWTKSKNAEFKIKIENTLFYDLKSNGNGGFIAIKKLVIIFIFTVAPLLIGFYLTEKINNRHNPDESLSGAYKAEAYKHYYLNPKTFELEVMHFDEDGKFLNVRQLTTNGYRKSNIKRLDNNSDEVGYFQDLHKDGEPILNQEEYYKNYTTLMIKQSEYAQPVEVYRGDYHTSFWEWPDNNHVVVYYGCGTECRYYYKINILTKEVEDEGHVDLGS